MQNDLQKRSNARAITVKYPSVSNVLYCNGIQIRYNEKVTNLNLVSIWDTGANKTAIHEAVARQIGLIPIDKQWTHTVAGKRLSNVFAIDLLLPNGVEFDNLIITDGILRDERGFGIDILLGMDVITRGDFAITNKDGKTVMSFRVPSLDSINFHDDIEKARIWTGKIKPNNSAYHTRKKR